MYVAYTYQDWLKQPDNKAPFIQQVIADYKQSADFHRALEGQRYFDGANTAIAKKMMLKMKVVENTDDKQRTRRKAINQEVAGARIPNAFFRMAVMQQVQFLLSNGVTLDTPETKAKLGYGFDNALEQIGEKAVIQGVCYGFWNNDHIEVIPAASDPLSGCVVLLDEIDSTPKVAIQFWQLNPQRPAYVRVFEHDGVTIYRSNDAVISVAEEKRAYKLITLRDAAGEMIIGSENYSFLPVIPFYANNQKISELTPSVKQKIDAYDRIISDLSDNLDRANDVYWALNNFGGTMNEALETLECISQLKAVINQNDGTGSGASAEPHTIDVPYAARQAALDILRKQLFVDYMALDMDTVTGGSLTNVAIKAAMANLSMKADRFEWHAFNFVQNVLNLIGVQTENISFKRQTISNDMETIQAIYTMRSDIDQRTALELNPYINQDDIDEILDNLDAQTQTGFSTMENLQKVMTDINGDDAD